MREYRQLLREAPFELVSLEDLGITAEVEETGSTFHENARLKARSYAALSGMLTLADDSGLEVDALGGEPGVRSSRYGDSQAASDQDRVRLLLKKLAGVPWERRTARFRCVIAIATPAGEVEYAEGVFEGRIGYELRGDNGFGYDPIFVVAGREVTSAELPPDEKNAMSHRGQAAKKALQMLKARGQESHG